MSGKHRIVALFLGLSFVLALSSRVHAEPGPAKPGVVFVVEGIGGFEVFNASARWSLQRAGVVHDVREFVWTHGWGKLFKDLQDIRHLIQKSSELTEEIQRIKAADRDRPIYLLAKSGGTALALFVAEQLPPGTLERIILLSSAVSPSHDLRPALRATRGEIVSFYSPHDKFVLNWGTGHFGTADRVYGPSAGWCGFRIPAGLSPEDQALYGKLVQIPWQPTMILQGNTGSHTGTTMPAFLAREVAPWLKTSVGP